MRVYQTFGACLIASFSMLFVRAEDGPEKRASDNLIDSASLVKVCEFKIPFQKRVLANTHNPQESVCLRLSNNGTRGAVAMVCLGEARDGFGHVQCGPRQINHRSAHTKFPQRQIPGSDGLTLPQA